MKSSLVLEFKLCKNGRNLKFGGGIKSVLYVVSQFFDKLLRKNTWNHTSFFFFF